MTSPKVKRVICVYLKKSSLQKSFASLEKHLSCNVALQSKQRTHSTCHARSKTFSRYWSIIGFSHPAHDRSIARPRLPASKKKESIMNSWGPNRFVRSIFNNSPARFRHPFALSLFRPRAVEKYRLKRNVERWKRVDRTRTTRPGVLISNARARHRANTEPGRWNSVTSCFRSFHAENLRFPDCPTPDSLFHKISNCFIF